MRLFTCILLTFALTACQSSSENKKESPSGDITGTSKHTQKTSENMVYFKGGGFMMGSNNGTPSEQPVHQVQISSFRIDRSPVTVAEFTQFVEETGFKTDAEKFGDSGVFNFATQSWELKKGAYWLYPLGRDATRAEPNHPVTHISWNDAQAYCSWAGKRLPTEAEWEYAARNGGKSNDKFSWGNELVMNGKYMANTWQGATTADKNETDGFLYTSPVGYYGTTAAGMTDMGGNVWNWCQDTYKPYPGNPEYQQADPQVKVIRGGSFFYDQNGERSYTTTFRGQNTAETSLFNIGFRCAADAAQ